jgi:hypothetical protein
MDFILENHGSLYMLRPLTEDGTRWIEENIGPDNGYQPYYPAIVIEPRYVRDIITGIRNDGMMTN